MLSGLVSAMRPRQWTKNVFVLAPLVFAQSLTDPAALVAATVAFAAFCMAASAVYLFNDLRDREEDRNHPLKRLRPIASGRVSTTVAGVASVALAVGSLAAAAALGASVAIVVALYLALNALYSLGLKTVAILDVLLLSVGFVLRVLGGGEAIGVAVSAWLLLCTIFVSLLLAVAKRRHELILLAGDASDQRRVLDHYSPLLLDQMINVVTAGSVLAYALYSISPETVERFHTQYLVYTIPFVLFGIFRFLYLVYQSTSDLNPTESMLQDVPFMANMLLWAATVLAIIYLA
ncbi:MAG: decaprenyl-phosphate phosphoribosyltransferase [Thermoanaerobaculia bacterium]